MPVERLTSAFVRLFEVRVLHHFWLDEATTMLDALAAAEQEKRLQAYDVRSLLEIEPTDATATTLAGLGGIWKANTLGLLVALPAGSTVPDSAVLEFTLRIVDRDFMAYTAYGLEAPTSADAYDEVHKRVLRYRAGAAAYSNLTGCTRAWGASKRLFLTKEAPAPQASDRVEYLVNSGGVLTQRLEDPPGTSAADLGFVGDLPAFATHADVPAIAPVPGVKDPIPTRGILLPEGAAADTFALLRIAAVHPTDGDLSCTTGGLPKAVPPVFELRFKNRRTLWRRMDKADPETVLSEEGPFPLTHLGNPGTAPKPAVGRVKVERTGTCVTHVVSEVFM